MAGWLVVHPLEIISKGRTQEANNPYCPDSATAVNSRTRTQMRRLIVPAIGTGKTLKLRFVIARAEFTSNTIQATGKSS
jgi:hypothetical protein